MWLRSSVERTLDGVPSARAREAATPSGGSDAAAETIDPLNRWYRYPLARRLLPAARCCGLTPDAVTATHVVVGLASAACVAHGGRSMLVLAAVLAELRSLLDCLDGVLARATGRVSARGRMLDALGDGVAFVALAAALVVRLQDDAPALPAHALATGLVVMGALAAWAHEFYARVFRARLDGSGAALLDGPPAPEPGPLRPPGRGLVAFEWVFGALQRWVLVPRPRRCATVTAGDAERRERRARRAVAWLSWENAIALLTLGFLADAVAAAVVAALAWAAVVPPLCVAACRRALAAGEPA